MPKKFQRKIENFVCGHCGFKVKGSGYTNHCPKCLYSRHVDINPGDRAEKCGGLMEPIDFTMEKGKYILIHKCKKCNATKRCKMTDNDNIKILENLSKDLAQYINMGHKK